MFMFVPSQGLRFFDFNFSDGLTFHGQGASPASLDDGVKRRRPSEAMHAATRRKLNTLLFSASTQPPKKHPKTIKQRMCFFFQIDFPTMLLRTGFVKTGSLPPHL